MFLTKNGLLNWYIFLNEKNNEIFLLVFDFESLIVARSEDLALGIFSKYNNFHGVCWFLAKNLAF